MIMQLPSSIRSFYSTLGLFTLDFEFNQPGCFSTKSDFVSIFKTNVMMISACLWSASYCIPLPPTGPPESISLPLYCPLSQVQSHCTLLGPKEPKQGAVTFGKLKKWSAEPSELVSPARSEQGRVRSTLLKSKDFKEFFKNLKIKIISFRLLK